MVDRGKTTPLVLMIGAVLFLGWSIVLLLTPGGSKPLEWVQLILSVAVGGFAGYALAKQDPVNNRRCRYLLLAFGVVGAIMVLGLAADQNSSRTWARMGWGALLFGYLGSLIVWYRLPQFRATTIVMGGVGALILVGGVGVTLNCDIVVQNTWCDPLFEREQAVVEQIEVNGRLARAGRAGGTQGAALMAYLVPDDLGLIELTDPPGEWDYESLPPQAIEDERGVFTTSEDEFSDCQINARLESPPTGRIATYLVSCGLSG